MKLLLFSDLHCDIGAAHRLVEKSTDKDVVIGAGDFGQCRQHIENVIDVLRTIDRPAVVVPGNAESVEELTKACLRWPTVHVLHGNGVTIEGVSFFGIGGGIPVTPFGSWSYDFTEEQAAKLLCDCPANSVLVSHSPPHGAVDIDSNGTSFGSRAVRDTILEKSPRLVVCGHIHACWAQQAIVGTTPVMNAGPGGVEWTLDHGISR
jgi:Icc-related predicted phosphoesterase